MAKALPRVEELQAAYDAAQLAYEDEVAELNRRIEQEESKGEAIPSVVVQTEMRGINSRRETVQSEVFEEYEGVIKSLDAVADHCAGTIQGILAGLLGPDVPRGGTPEERRNSIATDFFDDVDIVDAQAGWENAREVAPEAAKMIRDGDVTKEEVQEFNDKYGDLLENPYFANALMDEVTADELFQFVRNANDALFYLDTHEDRALRNDLLPKIGAAIALSTGGADHSAPGAAQFEQFKAAMRGRDGCKLEEMVEEQLREYESAMNTQYPPRYMKPGPLDGYTILSQLTGAAALENPGLTLGPGFYHNPNGKSLAEMLVEWDHETHQAQRAAETGPLRNNLLVGNDLGLQDPLHAMALLSNTPPDFEAGDGPLAEHEEARLRKMRVFLDKPTSFNVYDEPMNMTRYLTGHREKLGSFEGFPDDGEAFGQMIHDASAPVDPPGAVRPEPAGENGSYGKADKDYENAVEDERRRALIAANFANGYQDALDLSEGTVNGQDPFGYHNQKLRSWLGTISAPYIEGWADAMQRQGGDHGPLVTEKEGEQDSVNFTRNDVDRFIARGGIFEDMAFDDPAVISKGDPRNPFDDVYEGGRPPALTVLRQAAHAAYVDDLYDATQSGEKTDHRDALKQSVHKWAPLTMTVYGAFDDADAAVREAMDRHNQVWRERFQGVIDAIPASQLIDGKWKSYVADLGLKHLTPLVSEAAFQSNPEGPEGKGLDDEGGKSSTMGETTMFRSAYYALGRPEAWIDKSGVSRVDWGSLDRSFVENGKLIPYEKMNDAQRVDFDAWVESESPVSGVIDEISTAINNAEGARDRANKSVEERRQ